MQPERRKFTVIVFCKPLVREDTADGGPPLNLARENNHKPRNSACCSLLAGVLSILVLLPTRECNAQPLGSFGGSVVPGTATWGGYVIPDVNNKLSLASLLYNRSVVKSLGVDDQGSKLIREYLVENGGSFKTKVISRQGGAFVSSEEAIAETEVHRAKSQVFLDEIITPGQWARLRQLAFQVEVGRIGLANALTGGRLGADSGIHEQQADAIRRTSEAAEASAKAEIIRIMTRMQNEVLAVLPPDQQKEARLLLGEVFVFKEEWRSSKRAYRGVAPDAESEGGYVIPNVVDKLSLASLLYNRSVATNLGLSAEDIDLINGYLEQNGGSFQSIAFIRMRSISQRKTEDELLAELAALRTKSAEFLEELIAPRQWARLRQMAYQVEVGRIGLANALTGGRLGADVGVDEQQTELIQIKAGEAEARAEEDIVRVLTELQDNVLAAITPGQRRQAKLLLGGPIVFQEELASSWKVEIPGWMESGKENN